MNRLIIMVISLTLSGFAFSENEKDFYQNESHLSQYEGELESLEEDFEGDSLESEDILSRIVKLGTARSPGHCSSACSSRGMYFHMCRLHMSGCECYCRH